MEDVIVSSIMTRTDASDSHSSNSSSQRVKKTSSSSKPLKKHGIIPSSSSIYKGVVPQRKNSHWGAQIYANHQRIWLGTFETESLAAAAYDSAAIKLRSGNSGDHHHHRNLPWTAINIYEPIFQTSYSTEQVLNMIKDGSYPTKFNEYVSSISQVLNTNQTNSHNYNQTKNEGYFRHELFRKALTPSDVGKLNRLVIPKRYALKFFPKKNDQKNNNPNNNLGSVGQDMELIFYDKSMISWKFRYCYWISSQSFVFTRGWSKFVKEKDLKAKDIVAFYMCESRENNGQGIRKFCMIDIMGCNGSANPSNSCEFEKGIDSSSNAMDQEGKPLLEGVEASITKEDKGIRLFGVQIC